MNEIKAPILDESTQLGIVRTDPFERADITSNTYYEWFIRHAFLAVPAQGYVAKFLQTFEEFPPIQKAASFTIDQVMEKLTSGFMSD